MARYLANGFIGVAGRRLGSRNQPHKRNACGIVAERPGLSRRVTLLRLGGLRLIEGTSFRSATFTPPPQPPPGVEPNVKSCSEAFVYEPARRPNRVCYTRGS